MSFPPESRPAPLAPSSGPSRRTLVRTAAWSVPAITLVSAAPAFAASLLQNALRLETQAGFLYEEGEPVSVEISVRLRAETVGEAPSGTPSPPVVLALSVAGVWPAGATITFTPQTQAAARGATPEWSILDDGVTLHEDGSATSTNGGFSLSHNGGLISDSDPDGRFVEIQIVATSPTGFDDEPVEGSVALHLVTTLDETWDVQPSTHISAPVDSGSVVT